MCGIFGYFNLDRDSIEDDCILKMGQKLKHRGPDDEGKFTFPKKLKTGDVLVFSYLGYETQKVSITDKTSFITLELTPDMVEMIGAVDTNKPYKSKRKKN